MIPDPVPRSLLSSLVTRAGGVKAAAELAHVSVRALERWLVGASEPIPWSVAFTLAAQLDELEPPAPTRVH